MNETALVLLAGGAVVGIAATVTMDVLSIVARRAGLVVGADGKWVGRWYLGMARGKFAHTNIAASPELAAEGRTALIGHYLIGIILAIVYVAGAPALGLNPGSIAVAVGYGLATCVFPWFMVYPALGFGAFGRQGPSELKLTVSSVWNHLFYGLGLWWASALLPLG
jgi:hypothetical protein